MWLEWTGWGGISGVVSLIALLAALAVTFIELRTWWLSPPRADVEVVTRLGAERTDAEEVIFGVRVVGVRSLNEVSIRRIGGAGGPELLGERVTALDARDGWVERATWKLRGSPPIYFIVSWREQARSGARTQAVRFGTSGHRGLERWKPYRWPFWPRKVDGRWVKEQASGARGMRGIFYPVDHDSPTA